MSCVCKSHFSYRTNPASLLPNYLALIVALVLIFFGGKGITKNSRWVCDVRVGTYVQYTVSLDTSAYMSWVCGIFVRAHMCNLLYILSEQHISFMSECMYVMWVYHATLHMFMCMTWLVYIAYMLWVLDGTPG